MLSQDDLKERYRRRERIVFQRFDDVAGSGSSRAPVRSNSAPAPFQQELSVPKKRRLIHLVPTVRSIRPSWIRNWPARLLWISVLILAVRLVVMDRGLTAYMEMNDRIERREGMIAELKEKSSALAREIKLIQTSPRYQERMARKYLGVIAADEYLFIFDD